MMTQLQRARLDRKETLVPVMPFDHDPQLWNVPPLQAGPF